MGKPNHNHINPVGLIKGVIDHTSHDLSEVEEWGIPYHLDVTYNLDGSKLYANINGELQALTETNGAFYLSDSQLVILEFKTDSRGEIYPRRIEYIMDLGEC